MLHSLDPVGEGEASVAWERWLITLTKGYEGKRPGPEVCVTKCGRHAFQPELAALKQLVQHFQQPGAKRPQPAQPAACDAADGYRG